MRADIVEIEPLGGPLRAEVRVPGSKSMTNRALILAALADGPTVIENALRSDDTDRMVAALGGLGFAIEGDEAAATMSVVGRGGRIPRRRAELFVGASGTCARFLTALVALGSGDYGLDGTPRMRQRPIAPLLEALGQLGVEAASQAGNGCLPVRVRGRGLRGGRASIDASVSSQFVSRSEERRGGNEWRVGWPADESKKKTR